ncbi:MAG: hypothetical protein KAW12_24290 [Candidatus Aminicenantes bacterium]|nr:hypothetical protein [Candidatus Aminicenantes bacterium]
MTKKILKIAVLCLLGMSLCLTAEVNVTGKWTISIKTGKAGEKSRTFEFVQEAEKLDVYKKRKEGKKKVADGTVKGDKIEWTITRKKGAVAAIFNYVGTVSGDTMKGELLTEKKGKKKPSREWTANRKKPGKPK